MEHTAETGYSLRRNYSHHEPVQGFQSKNPFTSSIAQGIQNNRTPGIQSIDDVPLPPPANFFSRRQPRPVPPYHQGPLFPSASVPHVPYVPPISPHFAPSLSLMPSLWPIGTQHAPVLESPESTRQSQRPRRRSSLVNQAHAVTPQPLTTRRLRTPLHVLIRPDGRSAERDHSHPWYSDRRTATEPSHSPYRRSSYHLPSPTHPYSRPRTPSHHRQRYSTGQNESGIPLQSNQESEVVNAGPSNNSITGGAHAAADHALIAEEATGNPYISIPPDHRRLQTISESSESSAEYDPPSLRSYLRGSDSPISPLPYIPMPRPPMDVPVANPPPSSGSRPAPVSTSQTRMYTRPDTDSGSTRLSTGMVDPYSGRAASGRDVLSDIPEGSTIPSVPSGKLLSPVQSYCTPASHSVPSVQSSPHSHHVTAAPGLNPEDKYMQQHPSLFATLSTHESFTSAQLQMEGGAMKLQDYVSVFLTDTLPRQIYLHFLLRLPYLYFSRVDRIFKDADLTLEEIKEMALQASAEDSKTFRNDMLSMGPYYYHPDATNLSPAYQRLKTGWEGFIDNLMREWKTLNLVSVLLLSAIMTMFQIQGASADPVTRYIAFWSLICALLSLLYGCLFIIRFASMRKAYKAAEWALEARNSQTILWNVWVMLAMPVVWLAWSIITYIACIMSFMWRISANSPSDHIFSVSPSTEFGFRIFICVVLGTGMIYGILVINTFRRYGANMDEAWRRRVESYMANADPDLAYPPPLPQYIPVSPMPQPKAVSERSSEGNLTPLVGVALTPRSTGSGSVSLRHFPDIPPPIFFLQNPYQPYQPRSASPSPSRGRKGFPCSVSRSPSPREQQRGISPSGKSLLQRSRSRSHSDTANRIGRRPTERSPSFTGSSDEGRGRSPTPEGLMDPPLQSPRMTRIPPERIPSPLSLSSGDIFGPTELLQLPKDGVPTVTPTITDPTDTNVDPGIAPHSALQRIKILPKGD